MLHKKYLIFPAIAIILLRFSLVQADTAERFILSDSFTFKEETANWSVDITAPKISGMADPAEQQKLNHHFIERAAEILDDYQESASHAAESIHRGDSPNFIYQYSYEIIPSCDEFFIFRTVFLYRSSSLETSCEYWTLDKRTGKLLDFSDIVKTPGELADIRERIFLDMKKRNDEIGAPLYWTEGDQLDRALEHVGEKHHWYFNEYRNLVITFDKFEVAPGPAGSPEFSISHMDFYYSGDQPRSSTTAPCI